jgi:ferritin-like metal-binding protein YciE
MSTITPLFDLNQLYISVGHVSLSIQKRNTMEENQQSITTLHNLLDYDVRKFISAEIHLKKSLQSWIQRASALQLKIVLQKYFDFVEAHIQKMEQFLEQEQISSLSLSNRIMIAFIEEAEEKLHACTDVEVKDACLLASIQSINHFKISMYGTAAAFSNALGMEKEAAIFHEAEINEKHIDDRLSQLAEHEINNRAKSPISLPQ